MSAAAYAGGSPAEVLAEIAASERELRVFMAFGETVHHAAVDHQASSCLVCFSDRR